MTTTESSSTDYWVTATTAAPPAAQTHTRVRIASNRLHTALVVAAAVSCAVVSTMFVLFLVSVAQLVLGILNFFTQF
jgi:hypothetical protein